MTWRVRNQNSSAAAMEFSAEQLKQMLQSGLMGEQQQFLPPGQPEDGPWLSAFQALIQLNNDPNSSEDAASRDEGTKTHGAGQSSPTASSPTQESSSPQRGGRQKKVPSRKPGESRTKSTPKQQRVPNEKRSATGKGRSTDDDPTPVTPTGEATSESSAAATGTAAPAVTPVPTQRRASEPAGASLNVASAGNGPGGGAGSATLRRSERRLWAAEDEEDELEITPMIDMTFLLLIFFMVTSSVTAMATLELPNSRTGRSEKTEERVVLVVDFPAPLSDAERTPMTGSRFIKLADAQLYFQNEPERVFPASQIDSELKKSFQEKPGSRFVLQANRKMPVGVVRQLIKSAVLAGAAETLVGVSMPR